MIATACTIETIIEDPLLPILKEDSNITKPAGQIRRPGFDHHSTSPRFKLFMIDLIPHPKIGVFFNVRPYFRKTLSLSLGKEFFQSFFSCGKYIPFTPLSARRIKQAN
jgi:hypothetical protein